MTAIVLTAIAVTPSAHETGLSRGHYAVEGAAVTATLIFARRDVARAAGVPLPDDAPVATLPADAHERLSSTFARGLVVSGDGAPCPAVLEGAAPNENDGIALTLRARCAAAPRSVQVETTFLFAMPFGHRHLARTAAGEAALTVSHRTFSLSSAPHSSPFASAKGSSPFASAERSSPFASAERSTWRTFLGMGVEHILTGYDHLVFLLGLVVLGGALRRLLVIVTAFTVGHSISLALATLGVVTVPSRVVEPLIAASIVYVGVENLWALRTNRTPRARWVLTLVFGFVHGFGFADALRTLQLPRAELPKALALFNGGVELGQLVVLALLVPLGWAAARRPTLRARALPVINGSIALAGLAWLLARIAR
ncbi:MAG: HupE/UreJ family protein [Deltaproteobacteria bacterium]|nr:HupE/UreJ family protein [Deltaproteobacteria bacterium]